MSAKKNPKKADPMLGALAASFGAAKVPPAAAPEEQNDSPPSQEGSVEKPSLPAVASSKVPISIKLPPEPLQPISIIGGGVKKTTVSFHDGEQDKIDLILDALKRSRRRRGGFSDAIKIALKLCPLDDEAIGRAWDEARAQDQRVLRHRRDS